MHTKPFRIKEDMYVYKRFCIKVNKNKRSITVRTPYQFIQIARNKVQHFNCIDFEYNTLDPVNTLYRQIQYDYHAYEAEKRALFHLCPGEIIVKYKIPAGSHVWFDTMEEVCSNKLVVDITHNTKDIVTSYYQTKDFEVINKCFKYMH